jgi:redox-sensitive bicupin YhaK (pirin superfamily)
MQKVIERIIPGPEKPGMVGDGFKIFNIIPGTDIPQKRVSPFLMLDFNAECNFEPSDKVRGVNAHPHKGFETVTIVYKGCMAHHDSSGNSGVINAGDVQWMTAGNGVLHKEYHEEQYSRKGGPFEMVQLWVNLPKRDKSASPHYQNFKSDQLVKVSIEDAAGEVNVIAGSFRNAIGPAITYSPVNLFDIRLKNAGAIIIPIPATHNTALLVINGSIEVDGILAEEHSFILFKNEGEEISIRAADDSVILLLSGEPINEPIASYGPFVMNSQEEIQQAIHDFQSGKFGVLE